MTLVDFIDLPPPASSLKEMRSNGQYKPGGIPWIEGRHHTKASKEKMRQAKLRNPTRYWLGKKRILSDDHKKHISESNKGKPSPTKGMPSPWASERNTKLAKEGMHPFQKPSAKAKVIKFLTERNPMNDPIALAKLRKSLNLRPSKPEKAVLKYIKDHGLPFTYTGDYNTEKMVVHPTLGVKFPDLTSEDGKTVIEVGVFWHDRKKVLKATNGKLTLSEKRTIQGMISFYAETGRRLIIISEKEAKDRAELDRIFAEWAIGKELRHNNIISSSLATCSEV